VLDRSGARSFDRLRDGHDRDVGGHPKAGVADRGQRTDRLHVGFGESCCRPRLLGEHLGPGGWPPAKFNEARTTGAG